MKKLFSLLLSFALVFTLAGCSIDFSFGDGDEEEVVVPEEEEMVEESEEEEVTEEPEEEEEVEEEPEEESEEEVEEEPEEEPAYEGANYITVTSPENEADFHEEPVEFKGVVSPNTEKIVVTATIPAMDMDPNAPNVVDVYTLQEFKFGDSDFIYRASMEWNNLNYGTNEYDFEAFHDDGSTSTAHLTVFFSPATAEMGKPVIYLYPERTAKIFVDVEPEGGISVSEPELGKGWTVVATSDSKIYNFADGGIYPYLFWEGYAYDFVTPEEGFVVESEGVEKFFDEKLAILGLNEVEIADFKEFWVPRLNEDPYYFITFISQENFDKYAPLTVSPEPDSVIRVFFDYKGLDKKMEVKEQKLATPEREGFTVVEWGGRLYR